MSTYSHFEERDGRFECECCKGLSGMTSLPLPLLLWFKPLLVVDYQVANCVKHLPCLCYSIVNFPSLFPSYFSNGYLGG